MSRYIDADAIKEKKWQAESEACFYALEDVISVTDIDEAPSIELVTCKNCRYRKMKRTTFRGEPFIYYRCGELDRVVEDDEFCSWGDEK